MGIFGKGKDRREKGCSCGGAAGMPGAKAGGTAEVKVLGTGCAKCNALERAVREALSELGMDTAVEHVTDFVQIAAYGVMATPALVIDGKAVSSGRTLSKEEVKTLLRAARN